MALVKARMRYYRCWKQGWFANKKWSSCLFSFFGGPPRFGRAAQENNQGHRAAQKKDVAASADANNKNASTWGEMWRNGANKKLYHETKEQICWDSTVWEGERGGKVIIRILMFRVYASERTFGCWTWKLFHFKFNISLQENCVFLTQKAVAHHKVWGKSITMYNMWCLLWYILHWNGNLTLGNGKYYIYHDKHRWHTYLSRLRNNWRRSASKLNHMQQCATIRAYSRRRWSRNMRSMDLLTSDFHPQFFWSHFQFFANYYIHN